MNKDNNNHSITSVKWEVEIKEETKATSIYEELNQLFKEQMIDIIDEVFSQHSSPYYHIRIDELVVDLGNFEENFKEEEIIERFKKVLKRSLTAKLFAHPQYRNQPLFEKHSKIESDLAVFQYFLKYGNLPNYRNQTNLSLEQIVKEQLTFQPNAVVFSLQKSDEVGINRFVEQFSIQTSENLIRVLSSHYYLTILQQLKIFERLYAKLLPATISLRTLLYKGALSYLIRNQGSVFDLSDFQQMVVQSIQTILPISANEESEEVKMALIQHYLIHGWLPNTSKENINTLIQSILKKSPTKLKNLLQNVQSYPQALERIEGEISLANKEKLNTLKINQEVEDRSELKEFIDKGVLPSWATKDFQFENWLVAAIKKDSTIFEKVIERLQLFPRYKKVLGQIKKTFEYLSREKSSVVEKNELEYISPVRILNRFFETGIVPIWASTDIVIFENWLIKELGKKPTILKKYEPVIVVNRIVGVFTIESVFRVLKILKPKLEAKIQFFIKEQTQNSVWEDKTELVLFVLEKTLLKVLESKGKPIEIATFIEKIEREIGIPPTPITIEEVLQTFFKEETLPVWTDGKPMIFEQWFLTSLKHQRLKVLQQLKQEKTEIVVSKIVNILSVEGLLTTLSILHLPSFQLINNYNSILDLSNKLKRTLAEKALNYALKMDRVEVDKLETILLAILEEEGKQTKQVPIKKKKEIIRQNGSLIEKQHQKDTIAYILQEGKLPFWVEKSKNVDELLLRLIEEEPKVLQVIFKKISPSKRLEQTIVEQFSEVAISQLLNALLPNFFGFINTTALAIEQLINHNHFPTKSEQEREHIKWEGILKYVFTTLNQTFNINEFVRFVLEEVAKKEHQSKEKVFNWTIEVIEKAIEKGEKRFSPLKNILFSQKRNFVQSTVSLSTVTPQHSQTYNSAFLKLLSNKGITITNFSESNETLVQYQPLIRLVTLEYFFLYGAFPVEALQKGKTIDELLKTILKESPIPVSHIFRKNNKKEGLLKILIPQLTSTTFQQIIRLFYPSQAKKLTTYHTILQSVFEKQKIGSQTIETAILEVHRLKYVMSTIESKFTTQHYTQQFLKTITRVYRIEYKTVLSVLENQIDTIPVAYQKTLKQTVTALQKILPKRYKPVQATPSQESYRTWREPKVEEVLYVKNAGLVLVYPLLSFYFKSLEMITPLKKFKSPEMANRAIHLLQYIATKEENTPEYELSLNKILCNVPFGKPVESGIELTENEKKWSEELLKVVIKQWKAIKNTSPDGLRNSFLKREGRLSKKDAGWVLRVDKKPYDLLLGKLPWGLSTIRLPWMKEMLYVEWT